MLREELADRRVALPVPLENLCDRHLEVLASDVDSSFAEGVHT